MSTERFLVSMPEQYLNKLDRLCEQTGLSRSEILRRALDIMIENGEQIQSDIKGSQ